MAADGSESTAARKRRRAFYVRTMRRAAAVVGGPVERRTERFLLERAWAGKAPDHLERYLVGDYQNPLINVQSILLRHEFIRELGVDRQDLVEDELQWAVDKHRRLRARQRELQRERGEGFEELKNSDAWRSAYDEVMHDGNRFALAWTAALQQQPRSALSVMEAACGSANDYRAFAQYGLAPLLAYTGFDLTGANIANSRRMFPGVDFLVGDVQAIDAADGSYDWTMANDLLEHLSPSAMERAIGELSRVSRGGVLISFFRMSDIADHRVHATRSYHVNELSKDLVEKQFAAAFSDIRWVHVPQLLVSRYGFADYYNRRAWTMIARR